MAVGKQGPLQHWEEPSMHIAPLAKHAAPAVHMPDTHD
jgi:hypothetical protein